MNILLTGFGPFPGAPFNPTERLVRTLVRSRLIALAGVRPVAHVFVTRYDAVDRDLPALLARTKPDVWVMFGLAGRTRHVRIETRARNVRSRLFPDAGGRKPRSGTIAAGAVSWLPLRAPTQRLVRAALATGVTSALSHDAGRYLCNYLCWRATEAAARSNGPRVTAFVHVPKVHGTAGGRGAPLTFGQLVRAGEAIVRAAIVAARTSR